MKLHRDLRIPPESPWLRAKRLRATPSEDGKGFSGPAEAVVTYIGSKRKNMGNSQREEVADTGRGLVGETAVTRENDGETNLVVARVVQSTDAETPQGFVKDRTDSRATTYTDDPKVRGSLSSDRDSVQRSPSDQRKGDEHAKGMS